MTDTIKLEKKYIYTSWNSHYFVTLPCRSKLNDKSEYYSIITITPPYPCWGRLCSRLQSALVYTYQQTWIMTVKGRLIHQQDRDNRQQKIGNTILKTQDNYTLLVRSSRSDQYLRKLSQDWYNFYLAFLWLSYHFLSWTWPCPGHEGWILIRSLVDLVLHDCKPPNIYIYPSLHFVGEKIVLTATHMLVRQVGRGASPLVPFCTPKAQLAMHACAQNITEN